ncbi:hypothetical protein ACXVUM_01545 [Williamsia sp. SKLECPSW1]
MSPDDQKPSTTPTAHEHKRTLWSRIPRHILGGRVRTTTAVMVVVFIGLLALYGQRVDHYASVDADRARNAPRFTPTTTQDYVPETTRSSTRRSVSSTPSTPSTTSRESDSTTSPDGGSGPTQTAPTTTTGGLRFPPIPGLQIPGQTPTTTPAR